MSDAPERVSDAVLTDLRERLRNTRRVPLPPGYGWERGTDADYLAGLVAYWAESYDWRVAEDRIGALPWVRTSVEGVAARAVHQRSNDDAATAVVLLHGWPDSVLRFERVLPLLTDLHVVVPCLAGFPFAASPAEPGTSPVRMAALVAAQLAELGYDRYVVSGGDIGSRVAEVLADTHPERVSALHLTDIPLGHMLRADPSGLDEAERAYLEAGRQWQTAEGAYAHAQGTKPHTLAAALGDSPAGLAAWIVEKLRSWSDCGGDVETAFPRDDLLTWVTSYWVTGAIGTSFGPYVEPREHVERLAAPTAVTLFPRDLLAAPRSFAERFFDVRVWDEAAAGGHFAAWERPADFVAGLRAAVALAG